MGESPDWGRPGAGKVALWQTAGRAVVGGWGQGGGVMAGMRGHRSSFRVLSPSSRPVQPSAVSFAATVGREVGGNPDGQGGFTRFGLRLPGLLLAKSRRSTHVRRESESERKEEVGLGGGVFPCDCKAGQERKLVLPSTSSATD